jgi:hypothetical protein
MGEKEGGGMDYGVDEPTSSLDDSRSTSMVGAREGLARRMETDANIRDLNARIPDVQTGMPLLNNQDMSRDFFVNRASRGLQSFTDPIASFFMGPGYASEPASFSPLPASTNLGRGDDFGIVNQEMIRMSPFEQGIAALTGRGSDRASERRADYMTPLQVGSPSPLPNVRPSVMPVVKTKPMAQPSYSPGRSALTGVTDDPFAPLTQPGDPRRYDVNPYGPGVTDVPTIDSRPRPDADEMTRYVSPIGFDTRDEALDATVGADFFGEGTLGPLGTDEATTLANLVTTGKTGNAKQEAQKKTIGQRLQELGKKISDFSFSDLKGFIGDVLRGDPNYKGPSAAQLQLAQVPGPGPYVGGGVPSPSAEMGGGAPSPIQCPPGFKFDPVMNVCVPIVAPAPPVTTTPAPGTTAPAPATGGISNIPNVYPFTLTPPIGAPIGNIAPVRS